jgi:3-isopropylmalate dehydratase small subunit
LTIDLEMERIEIADRIIRFDVDPAVRRALMLGLDRIGETLTHADKHPRVRRRLSRQQPVARRSPGRHDKLRPNIPI